MKYVIGLAITILLSGCAITGSTILAFTVGAVTVAENVAEVATIYKETKEYLQDTNTSKE